MRQVNVFLDELRKAYLQQGQLGRILLPGSFLLVFCCLCVSLSFSLRSRNSSNPLPGPVLLPTEGTEATPTALFGSDFLTFTPFPTSTFFVPTAFPTFTPSPTGTQTPTQIIPTATITPVPTNTPTLTPSQVPPTATSARSVEIINVDKAAEYVEIQNFTQAPVDLRGWRLVSEVGNESCALRGTLNPNEVLRIWSRRGDPGFDCRLGRGIWSDNQADPAVLYNPQGEEVSRYP
jgi:Lamin Tail Domain